jgi:predicted neuraminidase
MLVNNWRKLTLLWWLVFLLQPLSSTATAQMQRAVPFFETGVVVAASESSFRNAYPVIARTANGGLLTVWCLTQKGETGGRIVAATSRDEGRTWTTPVSIINTKGKFDADPNIIVDNDRIMVFSTTVGIPNKIDWSEMWVSTSDDNGLTWSAPVEVKLPFKYSVGKRHIGLRLRDGSLEMPISFDVWAQKGTPARTEGEMDLKSGVLISTDRGKTWTPFVEMHTFQPKVLPGATNGVAEPAIVELQDGSLFALMRTGTDHLFEARSRNGGRTWTTPVRSALQGHNAPASLLRLNQNPKEIIVIWNNSPRERRPLSVAISSTGGRRWSKPRDISPADGPVASYPGIAQDRDGNFVAVWQQVLANGGREIRYARFNRAWVLGN